MERVNLFHNQILPVLIAMEKLLRHFILFERTMQVLSIVAVLLLVCYAGINALSLKSQPQATPSLPSTR